MNPCEEFELLISARLDGELTSEEEARLDAHLSQCPSCRALAQEIQAMQEILAQQTEEVPQGLQQRLAGQDWSQIPQEAPLPPQSQTPPQEPKKPRRRVIPLAVCSAAAVLLLVVALWQVVLPGGSAGDPGNSFLEFFSWGGSQSTAPATEGSDGAAPESSEQTSPDREGLAENDNGKTGSAGSPNEGTYGDDPTAPSTDPSEEPGTGSEPGYTPPEDSPTTSTPTLTVQQAQSLLSSHLASQGRSLTLVPSGLVGDSWVFAGKDASGRTVATFSVSQVTGQIQEQTIPDGAGEIQIHPPTREEDGPQIMD